MIENRPWLTFFAHVVLAIGIAITAFPFYLAFVASTHELGALLNPPVPLWPGSAIIENYTQGLSEGAQAVGAPVWQMMLTR